MLLNPRSTTLLRTAVHRVRRWVDLSPLTLRAIRMQYNNRKGDGDGVGESKDRENKYGDVAEYVC
jgi:hypothetical protein